MNKNIFKKMNEDCIDMHTDYKEMSEADWELISRARKPKKAVDTILLRELANMGMDTGKRRLNLERTHLNHILAYFEVPELDNPDCDLKIKDSRRLTRRKIRNYITRNLGYQERMIGDESREQKYALV